MDGTVTGISPGDAVITVTTVDGGFITTTKVTVQEDKQGSEEPENDDETLVDEESTLGAFPVFGSVPFVLSLYLHETFN
ncbi:hypothetical protein Pryu01_00314 [Paraliobacillus ryukyuensis]|uniref:Ig-like protein group 2 n=2 Tax=Paraliobacillus ryukyuensis TaxID=200904 RepID=A0A366EGV4_9BACI|nr:hypothetical protein DES48_101353 [Paraliobacillus ryukyuensis]